MSKVLKMSFSVGVLIISSALINVTFGQCVVKTVVKNNVKTVSTTDYYTYIRAADAYDGLAINLALVTTVGGKTNSNLNIVYTSTLNASAQTMVLVPTDSSKQIGLLLVSDGSKFVDNPKLKSNAYHTALPDSLKKFLTSNPIAKLRLLDGSGQLLISFNISESGFLGQQLACLQSPPKRKPVSVKKTQNR